MIAKLKLIILESLHNIMRVYYYLCNYSRRGVCYGIGPKLHDITKHIKDCIIKYDWSSDDLIDIITEEDAFEPGGHILGHASKTD